MKKRLTFISIALASVFSFIGATQNPHGNLFAKAETTTDDETVTETEDDFELPYGDMLKTYYEWGGYDVATEEAEDGKIVTAEDSNGNETVCTVVNNKLVAIGGITDCSFAYDVDGNLVGINDNDNVSYTFLYEDGNLINGKINGNVQYTNGYDVEGNLTSKTYANGNAVYYFYNTDNQPDKIRYNDTTAFTFEYTGTVEEGDYTVIVTDEIRDVETEYRYEGGHLVYQSNHYGTIETTYVDGQAVEKSYSGFSAPQTVSYGENTVNFGTSSVTYSRNENGDLSSRYITTEYGREINPYDSGYQYTRDANGNVTVQEAGTVVHTYEYNAQNQLVRETTPWGSYLYTYDMSGNILSKTETNTNTTVFSLQYDESNRLVQKGEENIEYDLTGNPLNYNAYELIWGNERQLLQMNAIGRMISYTYDENGYRTSKTVNDVMTNYVWEEGRVVSEQNDGYSLYFMYGLEDELIGFTVYEDDGDETTYYYLKNGLNDIVSIANEAGEIVVYYEYDAYGNLLDTYGLEANTIGKINPYRYRSYLFDEETGFYYLQSRYYDPEIGRFISADDVSMLEHYAVNANYNLYAYAYNNPMKYADPEGNAALVIGGITLSVGAVILLSATIAIAFLTVFFPTEFNYVCRESYDNLRKVFNACKKAFTTPWMKLTKSGKPCRHHIVAKAAKPAQPARNVLIAADIDPETDSRNIVKLKQRFHIHLHTEKYYTAVNLFFEDIIIITPPAVSYRLFVLKALLTSINIFQ